MSSLAQSIFDTATILRSRRSGRRHAYNDHFRASNLGFGQYAGNFREDLIDIVAKDIPEIARELSQSVQYSIDQAVADAVVKMSKTSNETFKKAFKFAKLPFPRVWIEFCLPEGDLRQGWLLSQTQNGNISLKFVESEYRLGHIPMHNVSFGNHVLITRDGVQYHPSSKVDNATVAGAYGDLDRAAKRLKFLRETTLSYVLLLNSRSNIIKADTPEPISPRNRKKTANLGRLAFDVARILGRDPNISPDLAG